MSMNAPPLSAKKIPLQLLGELTLAQPMQHGRPAFIAAANGLVRYGDHFFVVADDELQLGIFSALTLQPGSALPLRPGELPHEPKARKRSKPDFEVLVQLPPSSLHPHGALLVLGSGSKPQRNLGVLIALNAQGLPHSTAPLTLDLTPLYALLEREFDGLNIEGAVVQHTQLLLMQRGNKKRGINAIVALDLATLLQKIITQEIAAQTSGAHIVIDGAALRNIQRYALGSIDGVALGFTDATVLSDHTLIALAVAEDTDDSYADGATIGCCACRFDADNRLTALIPLATPAKTEGIAVWQRGINLADTVLALVTDADDPAQPAKLLSMRLDQLR